MLSLQEIQSKSFEKAVFGGYDMRSVDEFLEKIAEDYSVFQKENATLKAKMKVLIEKIEEYRTVEESMRKALLSAQNIADEMVTKAKLESELLISNAKKSAKDQITKIANEIKAEEQRLEEARDKTQTFAMKITEFYQNEIDGILRLSSALDLSETSKTREQEIKDFKLEVDFKENEKNDLMSDTIDTSKKNRVKALKHLRHKHS